MPDTIRRTLRIVECGLPYRNPGQIGRPLSRTVGVRFDLTRAIGAEIYEPEVLARADRLESLTSASGSYLSESLEKLSLTHFFWHSYTRPESCGGKDGCIDGIISSRKPSDGTRYEGQSR